VKSAIDLQIGELDDGSMLARERFMAFRLRGGTPLGQAEAGFCDEDAVWNIRLSIHDNEGMRD
jgi:hypothetical protein